jgi:hypothetical protein
MSHMAQFLPRHLTEGAAAVPSKAATEAVRRTDASQWQHDLLNCGAAAGLREQKYVMAKSVDPTDREKPGRLRGI